MITRPFVAVVISLALAASGCSGSAGLEQSSASAPKAPACDEVALAVQQRVDEARVVLGDRTPRTVTDLQKTIKHLSEDRRGQANVAYARVKRGITEITRSSNRLLDRLSETVTECDRSATTACWPDVTTAYEAAGRTAIAILQGPLRTMLERVEALFTLDKSATTKETKSSYMELRSASKELRERVQHFADIHNVAAQDFNACISADEGTP